MSKHTPTNAWKPGASGNPLGRPPGARNKHSKLKLQDGFKAKGFDFIDEFLKLYRATDSDAIKAKMLADVAPFLYAKRRNEDGDGNPEEIGTPIIHITPEVAAEMLKIARGEV